MKSESYLTLHRQQTTEMAPGPERSKYKYKMVHVTSVAQLQFRDTTRMLFFLSKEN